MRKQDSLLRSTLLLTLAGVAAQGVGFYYRLALSREIGAERLGLYQLVLPVYAVLQSLSISGLAVAVSGGSAASAARRGEGDAGRLLGEAFRLFCAAWGVLAAGVLLLGRLIAAYLIGDARTAPALVCLLPCLFLTGVENLTKHHFYGLGETALPAGVELLEQGIRVTAVLGLLRLVRPTGAAETVALIVLGMGVSEVFSSLTLTLARRRRGAKNRTAAQSAAVYGAEARGDPAGAAPSPPRREAERKRNRETRERLLSAALPVGFTAVLGNLMGAANSLLLPRLLERAGYSAAEATELFGVAFGMSLPLLSAPFALLGALGLSLLPRLTRCAALGQRETLYRYLDAALTAVGYLVLPLVALLAALGGDWAELLFQDSRAGDFLLPFAPGVMLSAWESILAVTLNAIDRQKEGAGISLLCGGVQLLCTLLLTEMLGLSGYALGMTLSSALGVLLRLRAVSRAVGYRPALFRLGAAPVLLSLLLAAASSLGCRLAAARWGLAGGTIVGLLTGLAVCAAALPALLPGRVTASLPFAARGTR